MATEAQTPNAKTPAPHRHHYLLCAAAHGFLTAVALLDHGLAIALAEASIAVAYLDLALRGGR